MSDFYHIYLVPNTWVSQQEVEKVMSLAKDWFKYAPNTWIVYSSANVDQWFGRLEILIKPYGRVFICRLDVSQNNGWMNKEFWDWLNKLRFPKSLNLPLFPSFLKLPEK